MNVAIIYLVGYLIWLPIIYRGVWRDIRPTDTFDHVGVGVIAILFSAAWPIIAVAFTLKLVVAPKEQP